MAQFSCYAMPGDVQLSESTQSIQFNLSFMHDGEKNSNPNDEVHYDYDFVLIRN